MNKILFFIGLLSFVLTYGMEKDRKSHFLAQQVIAMCTIPENELELKQCSSGLVENNKQEDNSNQYIIHQQGSTDVVIKDGQDQQEILHVIQTTPLFLGKISVADKASKLKDIKWLKTHFGAMFYFSQEKLILHFWCNNDEPVTITPNHQRVNKFSIIINQQLWPFSLGDKNTRVLINNKREFFLRSTRYPQLVGRIRGIELIENYESSYS